MSYSVIGRGLLDEVPKSLDGVNKVLIIHPQPLAATAELTSRNVSGKRLRGPFG